MLLEAFDDIHKDNCGDENPGGVENEKSSDYDSVYEEADENPSRPENDPENSAYRRIVLIERMEKVLERDPEGDGAVKALQEQKKPMEEVLRCVRIPVVEKVGCSVKKPVREIADRGVHLQIIPRPP